MDQTIVITINGIVFHIEDKAYEALKEYLSAIKKHFLNDADSLEIITDIEARIAELLNKQLKQENRSVVQAPDIAYIISKLGKVSEFDDLGNQEKEASIPVIEKRLFRNTDDRILGGVCSGLAAYLGVQALWLRGFWIILFFFAGTGLFVYCILWAVVPAALSRADKLAMRGKAATIEELKQSIQEELRTIPSTKTRSILRDFVNLAGNILKLLLKVFGKFIGALLILIALFLLIGSIVGILASISGHAFLSESPSFFFMRMLPEEEQLWLGLSSCLTIFLPGLALLILGIRLVSEQFIINKYTLRALGLLWILALAWSIYQGIGLGLNFKQEGKIRIVEQLKAQASKTYYLRLNENGVKSFRFNQRLDAVSEEEEQNQHDRRSHHGLVSLKLEKSDGDVLELERVYYARGKNTSEAIATAEKIDYDFSQTDSLLLFNEDYEVPQDALFRTQSVNLILRVPEGSKLIVEAPMRDLLDSYYWWDCSDFEAEYTTVMVETSGIHCAQERKID